MQIKLTEEHQVPGAAARMQHLVGFQRQSNCICAHNFKIRCRDVPPDMYHLHRDIDNLSLRFIQALRALHCRAAVTIMSNQYAMVNLSHMCATTVRSLWNLNGAAILGHPLCQAVQPAQHVHRVEEDAKQYNAMIT